MLTFTTSWGESAGAISVALHMIANGGDTEGLFRGAFMHSGSPIPVGDITNGQKYYDALVAEVGCTDATDSLQCLREAPYDKLLNAINDSPGTLSYQVRDIDHLNVILTNLEQVFGIELASASRRQIPYWASTRTCVTGQCCTYSVCHGSRLSILFILIQADLLW